MSLLDPEVFKSYCHPIMLKDLAAQKIVYSFPSPLAKEIRVLHRLNDLIALLKE